MQPQGQFGFSEGQMRAGICSPRSSVISDLNGQIENILPKRVARRSSKIELRREPISVLSERIRIECVAYSAKMWYGTKTKFSWDFRPRGKDGWKRRTDLGSWRHLACISPRVRRGSPQEALRTDHPASARMGKVPI
jgi:hypothetical protein